MRNRILLVLLIIAALIGIGAVVWFVLRPVLPAGILQPPASTQQPSEKPFNPTPALPTAPTSTTQTDSNSPAERERQAQEALKRTSLDFAARLGSYSNADNFDSLRVLQASVDTGLATKMEALRKNLQGSHPNFGASWGQTTSALSAQIVSATPIIGTSEAKVQVQAQITIESAGSAPVVTQNRVNLTFKNVGNAWIVSEYGVQPLE